MSQNVEIAETANTAARNKARSRDQLRGQRPDKSQWASIVMDATDYMVYQGGKLKEFSNLRGYHPDWMWNRFAKVEWVRNMIKNKWAGHTKLEGGAAEALIAEILSKASMGLDERKPSTPKSAPVTATHIQPTDVVIEAAVKAVTTITGPQKGVAAERAGILMPLIQTGMNLSEAAASAGINYDSAWRAVRYLDLPVHAIPSARKAVKVADIQAAVPSRKISPRVQRLDQEVKPVRKMERKPLSAKAMPDMELPSKDGLNFYMQNVKASGRDTLRGVDQTALFQAWRERGDEEARNRIIEGCLRFVVKEATKWSKKAGIEAADLVQEGNVALFDAMEKFDTNRKIKFLTYAGWWVKMAIMNAVLHQSRTIRLPERIVEGVQKIRRTVASFEREHGVQPDAQQIAAAAHMKMTDVDRILKADRMSRTVDVAKHSEDQGEEMVSALDNLAIPADEDPDSTLLSYLDSEATRGVRMAMTALEPAERRVVELRYRMAQGGADEEETYAAIATALNKSREWARKLMRRALAKIGAYIRCANRTSVASKTVATLFHSRRDEASRDALEAVAIRFGLGVVVPEAKQSRNLTFISEWFGVDESDAADMERRGIAMVANALLEAGDLAISA